MIRYVSGNLLEAPVEALVNTVNTEGVMGKGIALQFKEAFPQNYELYRAACKLGEVTIGRMFVTRNPTFIGPQWIINFPTKTSWRQPSRLEYVLAGMQDLARVIHKHSIKSVALPPLGCGHGGLDWAQVKPVIESSLGNMAEVDVFVYEPTDRYMGASKRSGVRALTPARALIVESIRRYAVLGFECTNLEVQKLVYFLSQTIMRLGLEDPFKLTFTSNKFGPYSDALRHLLDALDGSYLHCEKRLADAGPFDAISVDFDRLAAVREYMATDPAAKPYARALDILEQLIDGFESPFLMELLSTVDVLQARAHRPLSAVELRAEIKKWPGRKDAGERKNRIFSDKDLELAARRLASVQAA